MSVSLCVCWKVACMMDAIILKSHPPTVCASVILGTTFYTAFYTPQVLHRWESCLRHSHISSTLRRLHSERSVRVLSFPFRCPNNLEHEFAPVATTPFIPSCRWRHCLPKKNKKNNTKWSFICSDECFYLSVFLIN